MSLLEGAGGQCLRSEHPNWALAKLPLASHLAYLQTTALEWVGLGREGEAAGVMTAPGRAQLPTSLATWAQSHVWPNTLATRPRPPLIYCRCPSRWLNPPHPFARYGLPSSESAIVFRSPSAGALHSVVENHVVNGKIIFPGVGYLEMAHAAMAMAHAATTTALCGVFFLQPLDIEALGLLLVECAVLDARFEVRSSVDVGAATVHCAGATASATAHQTVDIALLRERFRATDVVPLYDGFYVLGLQYGPGYRLLVQEWAGVSSALAQLRARSTHEGMRVHPADFDGALCASAAIVSNGGDGETRLPFAVDDALLRGAYDEQWGVRTAT